jgi:hypothetical protein
MRPKKTNIPIFKQAKDELKQATFLVLAPDEVDLHGDIYDADEVRKACHNFNRSHTVAANLFHMVETDGFSIAESYCAPVEMQVGEAIVKAGTWLVNLQFNDDDLWAAANAGEFSGVSIGALAMVEEIK